MKSAPEDPQRGGPHPVRASGGTAPVVAVIGGGFSGLLTAIHLLRRDAEVRVRLVERAPQFGRGRAYDATSPDHLLNVRAANMSAFPGRPDHFREWLAAHGGGPAESFVSRSRYGDYLQDLLREAVRGPGAPARLLLEHDEAVAIRPHRGAYEVRLAVGRSFEADAVVLALGFGLPTRPPFASADVVGRRTYVGDPWRGNLRSLPDGAILLIGSGLTMIDAALSLDRPGRELTVVSRRGLLPRAHSPAPPAEPPWGPLDTPSRALRTLRAHAEAVGWRSAVDSIRPLTTAIWRAWPPGEQRRFLRHLKPWWDVHRHRMAPQIAARLNEPLWNERLEILAGRIVRLEAFDGGFEATIRPRGAKGLITRLFRAVVNCTGPSGELHSHALLADLQAQALARADALGLGLDVDRAFRLRAADGGPARNLYAVGPLTRASVWEAVAVPDLRSQTADLSETVLADLRQAARL